VSKATKVEKQQRVDAVFDLLLQSVSRRGILQYAAKKGWDVAPRTIDWYIADARAELAELGRADRETEYGRAVGQLDLLFMQALARGDLRTARAVRKDLSELFNLVGPRRVEVHATVEAAEETDYDLSQLSYEEVVELRRLLAKAEGGADG